jgi:hypothetical protein
LIIIIIRDRRLRLSFYYPEWYSLKPKLRVYWFVCAPDRWELEHGKGRMRDQIMSLLTDWLPRSRRWYMGCRLGDR